MTEVQKYQLIDDYLKNKLSDKEALDFEKLMVEDPEFNEEVLSQKLANEIIIENRFFDIAKKIDLTPAAALKTGLGSNFKNILGISVSTGIVLVSSIFVYKSYNDTVTPSSAIVIQNEITNEVTNEEQFPTVCEDEVIVESLPEEPVSTPTSETAKNSEKDRNYLLEIPLENPNVKPFTFDPEKGELWTIPLKGRKNAVLKIVNKSGKEVYKAVIRKGYPSQWDGLSSGKKISGSLIYILDFGQGKVEHGYLHLGTVESEPAE
ncbi:MAG: gliding motility-associated C-terminal domain-containing protein [Cytophagaceae bacterium]